MRLLRLILSNYIGIYNGMGIKRIDIDFSRCTHKILVMKGDNGSGKSTVYRALSPTNDPTIEFIPGCDAEKIISYLLDDGSRLDITYTNQAYFNKNENRWRFKPAKNSILRTFPGKEPVELNPTGNVTTGKDILYDLFKLDDNFIVLSALSATNKGIGMQRPAERKRYVNVIIDSLAEFINMNKFLAKKGTILKSMMNSLTTKLSQIGNIELVREQLKNDTKTLNEMEIQKNRLIEVTTSIKNKLATINKDGDINELYDREVREYSKLRNRFSEIADVDPSKYSEEELESKKIQQSKVSTELNIYSDQLNDLVSEEESLRKELTEVEAIMSSFPDIKLKEETEKKYERIEKDIEYYTSEFEKIGFKGYNNISELEYKQVLHVVEKINNSIQVINTTYSSSIVNTSINHIKKHDFKREDFNRLLQSLNVKLEEYRSLFKEQDDIHEKSMDYSKIPKDCNHIDSCPFISSIVKAQSLLWDDKKTQDMISKKEEIEKIISNVLEQQEEQTNIIQCMTEIESLVNLITTSSILIDKFFGRVYFKNVEDIYHVIANSITININLQRYVEYTNFMKILDGLRKDKSSIEEMLSKYKDFNQSIHVERYNRLNKDINRLLEKKKLLLSKVIDLRTKNETLQIEIQSLTIIKSTLNMYEQLSTELEKSSTAMKELKSKVEENIELTKDLRVKNNELNQLTMNDMPLISTRMEKAKYQLILFDQYKKDYDEYNLINTRLQKVLYYSSTKGIQSVYIEAFMNSMLQLTNQLLSLLFNGRFMIKQFLVGENEFSIPCIDANGQERDDIAEMSDSQLSMISMIISFVILHKASEYYNIIKLDEVDANLDNTNRLQFAVLINKIIDILNFHQCIIISHNNEIDLSQVDMVVFKIEKQEELKYLLSSGANVIFNYNR